MNEFQKQILGVILILGIGLTVFIFTVMKIPYQYKTIYFWQSFAYVIFSIIFPGTIALISWLLFKPERIGEINAKS